MGWGGEKSFSCWHIARLKCEYLLEKVVLMLTLTWVQFEYLSTSELRLFSIRGKTERKALQEQQQLAKEALLLLQVFTLLQHFHISSAFLIFDGHFLPFISSHKSILFIFHLCSIFVHLSAEAHESATGTVAPAEVCVWEHLVSCVNLIPSSLYQLNWKYKMFFGLLQGLGAKATRIGSVVGGAVGGW